MRNLGIRSTSRLGRRWRWNSHRLPKASIYRGGYSKDWLKTKAYITREFVVIGYEHKHGDSPSLLLAGMADG